MVHICHSSDAGVPAGIVALPHCYILRWQVMGGLMCCHDNQSFTSICLCSFKWLKRRLCRCRLECTGSSKAARAVIRKQYRQLGPWRLVVWFLTSEEVVHEWVVLSIIMMKLMYGEFVLWQWYRRCAQPPLVIIYSMGAMYIDTNVHAWYLHVVYDNRSTCIICTFWPMNCGSCSPVQFTVIIMFMVSVEICNWQYMCCHL